jgi:hypothetical protein
MVAKRKGRTVKGGQSRKPPAGRRAFCLETKKALDRARLALLAGNYLVVGTPSPFDVKILEARSRVRYAIADLGRALALLE